MSSHCISSKAGWQLTGKALILALVTASALAQVPNQMILRKMPAQTAIERESDTRTQIMTSVRPVVSTNLQVFPEAGPSTPSVAPDAEPVPPASLEQEMISEVIGVRLQNQPADELRARAGLNDEIWIDVRGFLAWLELINRSRRQANLPAYGSRDVIPFFDGNPLPGIHPNYARADGDITSFRFKLTRDKESREAWSRLWKTPAFERRTSVSIGFINGEEMPTRVVRDGLEEDQMFSLILIRQPRFWIGVTVILGAFVAFICLARKTEIIRDTSLDQRPDGKWPYSLAKAQMAFWFFLVIASFFFLWTLTGAMDTLNNSVLILIGISAGTAIGAAMIDSTHEGSPASSGNVPPVDTSKPRQEIVAEISALIEKESGHLKELESARGGISSTAKEDLDKNESAIEAVRQKIERLKTQQGYFSYPAWKGVLHDFLGDQNGIGFHRFQIFVWTLLLGVIFITQVYNELAMPEFDSTLLGLLGISAGTYVGFKIPEAKRPGAG